MDIFNSKYFNLISATDHRFGDAGLCKSTGVSWFTQYLLKFSNSFSVWYWLYHSGPLRDLNFIIIFRIHDRICIHECKMWHKNVYHMLGEMDTTVSLDILRVHTQRERTGYHTGRKPQNHCTRSIRGTEPESLLNIYRFIKGKNSSMSQGWFGTVSCEKNRYHVSMINLYRTWNIFTIYCCKNCTLT